MAIGPIIPPQHASTLTTYLALFSQIIPSKTLSTGNGNGFFVTSHFFIGKSMYFSYSLIYFGLVSNHFQCRAIWSADSCLSYGQRRVLAKTMPTLLPRSQWPYLWQRKGQNSLERQLMDKWLGINQYHQTYLD